MKKEIEELTKAVRSMEAELQRLSQEILFLRTSRLPNYPFETTPYMPQEPDLPVYPTYPVWCCDAY